MQLRPSKALALAVGGGHLLALGAAGAGLPPLAAAFTTAGVVLSLVHYWRWATNRAPSSVAAIEVWPDGRLAIAGPAAAWRSAALRHAAVPAAWLTVLVARDDAGRTRCAVILPDALDRDAFRRLRVLLRWRVTPQATSPRAAADDARG